MYSDQQVVDFVEKHFVPVRVHVREQKDEFQRLGGRYSAQWTPTILIVDGDGQERYRNEGFLPKDDLLGQLTLGLGHAAFKRSDYAAAERWFRDVDEEYPRTEAAAEAQYWIGVSKYRRTNDASALKETAQAFKERFQDSSWAKKASVWQ